jgi:hypothetical protein
MGLLDADTPQPKPSRSRVMAFTVSVFALVAIIGMYFAFRYYPEKKTAEHFFEALDAGDMNKAYELWKPSPSYKMNDFLADWGPNGYYGPVKSYEIIHLKSPKGSNGVIVTARVSPFPEIPDVSDVEKSQKTRVVDVWVRSSDKSLSFPVP